MTVSAEDTVLVVVVWEGVITIVPSLLVSVTNVLVVVDRNSSSTIGNGSCNVIQYSLPFANSSSDSKH